MFVTQDGVVGIRNCWRSQRWYCSSASSTSNSRDVRWFDGFVKGTRAYRRFLAYRWRRLARKQGAQRATQIGVEASPSPLCPHSLRFIIPLKPPSVIFCTSSEVEEAPIKDVSSNWKTPMAGSLYYSEVKLRCYYTHLTTKNDLSPSQLLRLRNSKIARMPWRYMDVY